MRPRIGDVIEIPTSVGLGYALYTHKRDRWGALLRVFEGAQDDRPAEFASFVRSPIAFSVFFPLGAACNRKIVQIVANEAIPSELEKMPIFKVAGHIDTEGKAQAWWLSDGNRERKIRFMREKYKSYPTEQVVNDTALKEMVENGYTDRIGYERHS